MLESLIGDVYRANQQLPLNYGQMYTQQFSPYYAFLAQQQQQLAGNQGDVGQAGMSGASSLGSSSLGLYGQLANMQQEQQRFNSLAPVLGSLLNQFGGPGGGFNLPAISAIGDPMAGYANATGGAYQQLANAQNRAYQENQNVPNAFGKQFEGVFNRQANLMPRMTGGGPTQGPGVFDDPETFNYGQASPAPFMHGGAMTGGGNIGPGMPDNNAAYGGNPFAAPTAPQSFSQPAPQAMQSAGGAPDMDPVQWEMNRLRAEMTGGRPPQGLRVRQQTPGGGWSDTPYSVTPQQQEAARRALGRQFQQEAELRKYATQPPAQNQPQYRWQGSKSTFGGPTEHYYYPTTPMSFNGEPPGQIPGRKTVKQYDSGSQTMPRFPQSR